MSFLDELPKLFLILAPMDDVTDTVFRQIIADLAPPDVYFTEFVNVDGLQSPGRPRLLHKLKFTAKEKPIIAQLWGINPENFYKTTKELIEMGFDGVDLNFGCPVRTVIKNGACAALINNRTLAGEIIDATKAGAANAAAGGFSVSVKTRTGFKVPDLTWHEFLLSKKLDLLSIHGRTAKQLSKVPADWDLIGEIRQLRDRLAAQTLIAGNGDVGSRGEAVVLAKRHGLDGVMIGRGVFEDPLAFAEQSSWSQWTKEQKIDLYKKHVELFIKTYGPSINLSQPDGVQGAGEQRTEAYMKYGEGAAQPATPQSAGSTSRVSGSARKQAGAVRKIETLNKFCKIYINGFEGAREYRDKLMHAKNADDLMAKLDLLKVELNHRNK